MVQGILWGMNFMCCLLFDFIFMIILVFFVLFTIFSHLELVFIIGIILFVLFFGKKFFNFIENFFKLKMNSKEMINEVYKENPELPKLDNDDIAPVLNLIYSRIAIIWQAIGILAAFVVSFLALYYSTDQVIIKLVLSFFMFICVISILIVVIEISKRTPDKKMVTEYLSLKSENKKSKKVKK